ncbi:type II 3-dehydroquinate dehydratase [Kangiella profundi]|uniref:3-dehydroquinate dehydratase n=2 Tax=Kangiella TaxID=261963 RepID=A0A2K9AG23_9GAMM|nr:MULTISPECIES: type II 3-dehydroquinate dehydratase [Kangiella]AUD77894.1 type II 3-dehydroquinate dehydratase [Kangiella profundi]WQG85430.1 type II 3-dehydroquinate dehydratase [Kangiella aquimarina]GGE91643.1 3-dehydroquinate dehydratase [Kangiella profundi]
MAHILLLHGPNLNLLGQREPDVYGSDSLESIDMAARKQVESANMRFSSLQSNSEAELINAIQHAKVDNVSLIVINPAAFTHTSVALRDALLAVDIPFIEVHLSNPHRREAFRRHSYFSDVALAVVAGFGADSYRYAIDAAIKTLQH